MTTRGGTLLAMWVLAAAVAGSAQAPDPFAIPPKSGTAPEVRPGVPAKGPLATAQTAHLTLNAALSDESAALGTRLSIAYEIQPARGIHVYAPGKHDYQVIDVTLDAQPWLRAQKPVYPKSEIYHFKPLDERIEVFIRPFTLVQDVTILATPDARKLLAHLTTITISGKVNYQACDDKVCYAPQSIPVRWTLPLRPLPSPPFDRRPPE